MFWHLCAPGFRKKAVTLLVLAALVSYASDSVHAGPSDKPIKPPPCLIATFEQLRAQWQYISHSSLLTTTSKVGAGSQIEVVLSGPIVFPQTYKGTKSVADLDFRSFVVNSGKSSANAKPPKPRRNGEPVAEGKVRLIQETVPADIASKLHIEQQKNYLLQIDVPVHASRHIFWQRRHLVVVGCAAGLDAPVFWAETPIDLTPKWPPIFAGILLVVALYLLATTWVYFARRQSEKESDAKPPSPLDATAAVQANNTTGGQVSSLFRLEKINHWSWVRCLDPVVLTSDVFDRGNLGKLQILFFLMLVGYGLTYITIRTGELSSISPTIVALLGLSAFGALGSKVVATTRDRLSTENWAWLVSKRVLPINDPGKDERPRWTDLVMSDAELDVYKLQAFIFTLIVGVAMIVGGFSLATFSVPQELLEILGLSQVVFVGGRLAKPTSMGDLDDLVTELRKRENELRRAAASGVDVDASGQPALDAAGKPLYTQLGTPPFTTFAVAKVGVPNAARRYVETANEVNVLLKALSHRLVDVRILLNPELP